MVSQRHRTWGVLETADVACPRTSQAWGIKAWCGFQMVVLAVTAVTWEMFRDPRLAVEASRRAVGRSGWWAARRWATGHGPVSELSPDHCREARLLVSSVGARNTGHCVFFSQSHVVLAFVLQLVVLCCQKLHGPAGQREAKASQWRGRWQEVAQGWSGSW